MNGNINDENVFSVTFQEKKKAINIKLLTGLSFFPLRHLNSTVKNDKCTEFCRDRYAHSSQLCTFTDHHVSPVLSS